jgi:hypothetical protein
MLNFDNIQIEILEDGTIKTTSDKVSAANHGNAEEFLRYIARMAGGETTRTTRGDVQHEQHHGHQDRERQ